MATRCEVCGQYPIQGTIRTFFPWPADISQRAYWQTCLGIQDLDLSKPELFICSDHFDQLQMIRKGSTLRKDAFPKRYEGPLPTFPQGGEVPPEPPKMEPSLETPCPDVKNEDGIFGTSGPPAPLFDDEEIMPEELSMAKLLLLFTAAAKERPSGITPLVTPVAEETKAFSNILIDRQQKYLDSYCKSCLRQAELVNMMEANCEGVPVLLMYKSVFMTELDLSEIPQLMCHTCIGLLFQCFKFTTMTLRSCEVLRAARERFKYLPPLDDSDIDLKNIPEKYSATPAPIAAVIESDEDDKQEVKKVVRKRKATMKVKLSAPPKKKGRPARRASVKSKKVNKKILDSDVSSSESENFDNDEADPDFEDAAAIKDESPESSDVEPELEEKEEPEDEGDEEKVEEDENYCMLCRHKFSNMARHMDKVHRVDWENKSCERCKKICNTIRDIFNHVRMHERNIIKCPECHIKYEDKEDFEKHLKFSNCTTNFKEADHIKEKAKSKRKIFFCNQCNYTTDSTKSIFDHQEKGHPNTLDCIICDKTDFKTRIYLYTHFKVHAGQKYCSLHFKAFDTVKEFYEHHNRPGHDLDCGICDKKFSTITERKKHRSVEHKIKKRGRAIVKDVKGEFRCPQCPMVYGYSQNLTRHIKTFHYKIHFLCEDCGVSCSTKVSLQKHVANVHGNRNKTVAIQCEICGQTFKSDSKLIEHRVNKHLGSIHCKFCKESFERQELLDEHIKNTGHKTYECEKCSLHFRSNARLTLHILNHDNLKTKKKELKGTAPPKTGFSKLYQRLADGTYSCTVCPTKCKWQGNMYRHVLIHTGKQFPCNICGKKFAQKDGMKAHLGTHSDARPFKCQFCGAAFKDSSTFYKHRKRHITEENMGGKWISKQMFIGGGKKRKRVESPNVIGDINDHL